MAAAAVPISGGAASVALSVSVWRPLCLPRRPSASVPCRCLASRKGQAYAWRSASAMTTGARSGSKQILLLDVMSTLVRDPFYEDMPRFLRLSFKELLAAKHPTAWIEFEKGHIDEARMFAMFFKDGREFDSQGLKDCMRAGYRWLDGCESILQQLKRQDCNMHAFSNYPVWYMMIEEKLQLSQYLPWSFVSCHIGYRKPERNVFQYIINKLGVHPEDCCLVDDSVRNTDAARDFGMRAIQFQDANQLALDLQKEGFLAEAVGTEHRG
eukprot:jgi/Chlat1/1633/Chrsp127S01880